MDEGELIVTLSSLGVLFLRFACIFAANFGWVIYSLHC